MIQYLKLKYIEKVVIFMELKKCVRCGCFFTSDSNVCSDCAVKDKQDIYNLNNYIINSPSVESVDSLSFDTGVSVKNITRFINDNSISKF